MSPWFMRPPTVRPAKVTAKPPWTMLSGLYVPSHEVLGPTPARAAPPV